MKSQKPTYTARYNSTTIPIDKSCGIPGYINYTYGQLFSYDRDGYNILGYHYNGYNKEGYNILGYDIYGLNKDGNLISPETVKEYSSYKHYYNGAGKNLFGYGPNGYNDTKYDIYGYHKDNKYNVLGFHENGSFSSDKKIDFKPKKDKDNSYLKQFQNIHALVLNNQELIKLLSNNNIIWSTKYYNSAAQEIGIKQYITPQYMKEFCQEYELQDFVFFLITVLNIILSQNNDNRFELVTNIIDTYPDQINKIELYKDLLSHEVIELLGLE